MDNWRSSLRRLLLLSGLAIGALKRGDVTRMLPVAGFESIQMESTQRANLHVHGSG